MSGFTAEAKKALVINPIFEPLFSDHIDDPRYYQVYGGRGSGKSFGVSIAIIKKTYSDFKHKILVLRQTMASSEDSTISDIRQAIEILGVGADFKEANGTITNIRTGATISFKGIRSSGSGTAKLKSLSGITTLVVEEAEEVESFEEFSKVDESIRIKGKPLKVILVYNPSSAVSSWIHKEWFKNGVPNPARYNDTVYMHSTYLDNIENLNESVVQRYEDLKETNPIYYVNTILAEWTLETSGRVYAGWQTFPMFKNIGDTWYGLDFGYGGKDKTSLVKIVFFEGTYYVTEVFSVANLRIKDMLRLMRQNGVPFTARIYADSAMPLLITETREGGYTNIRKATKGNQEAGIKKVQDKDIVLIGDYDPEKPTGIYYEYMTWARDKKGQLPHEPDVLASLRYGINSHKPAQTATKYAPRRIKRKVKGFI